MTTVIDAKTARGAAGQVARAMKREARRVGGMTKEQANRAVYVRPEEHWDWNENTGRNTLITFYHIIWEDGAPYEWTITATLGGNIWDEELGRGLYNKNSEPTLAWEHGKGWWMECQNSIDMYIYPERD